MRKARYSPAAADDLEGILSYVSNELDSPRAGKKLVGRIREQVLSLERHPNLGERLDGYVSVKTDYRRLVCGNYLVFYRVEKEYVSVIRVLHGSRNYLRILFGPVPAASEEIEAE